MRVLEKKIAGELTKMDIFAIFRVLLQVFNKKV